MKYSSPVLAFSLAAALVTQVLPVQAGPAHPQQESGATSSTSDHIKSIQASKLIGVNVTSKDGQNLGQVQDLVFDAHTGKIQFALVGQGFMAGTSQKVIPVPWQAVKIHSEREFALNVDKSKMETAPAWSQSDYDQPDYVIRVYRFYEIEPRTDVGTPGQSGQEQGQGQKSSGNGEPSSPSQKGDNSPPDKD
jgi:sporulation protein YlmC with PRC-barrel domain